MSELTTERLEEIAAEYTHAIYPAEVGQMARELLSLRTAPAPGMEEVDALVYWPDHEFKSQQYPKIQQLADLARRYAVALTEERKRADEAEKGLRITVEWKDRLLKWGSKKTESYTRGIEDWAKTADRHVEKLCQQIAERDAENTSLEQRISRLNAEYEDLGKRFDEQASQIATLTAERDAEIERLKRDLELVKRLEKNWLDENIVWQDQNATLTAERDEARRLIRDFYSAVIAVDDGYAIDSNWIPGPHKNLASVMMESQHLLTLAEGENNGTTDQGETEGDGAAVQVPNG